MTVDIYANGQLFGQADALSALSQGTLDIALSDTALFANYDPSGALFDMPYLVDSREQAIFDAVFETMFDGGTVQTLWVYGADGYHWSTEAETIVTGEGTDNAKTYEYKDGEFHLRLNPSDPSALWKKNAIDPSSMICSLENGFESATDLTKECNEFFSEHSVDAPHSASCDAITNYGGTITDAKNAVIADVVVKGGSVDAAMENYVKTTQNMVTEILEQLNAK